jgi:hypothetical protein
MSAKTVFLSYRRDFAGKAYARLLKQALTHHGYDVFLDVDHIDAGEWAKQILTRRVIISHRFAQINTGQTNKNNPIPLRPVLSVFICG